ncbi:helix-turn-helix transcriptional regulator [Deinococcus marmoris]|uniref:helix-turn-helix transcriptional regulator n=1 Tax=Deinococcus marmoris TaxID=249408 RepID=UPI00158D9D37|nr:helix-turn-helix transcriptional regulator [Deinococcus marmoris]
MNQDVRQAVKTVIKEKGLTQEQVAEALGVNRVYVNRMLSGSTSKMPGRWSELLEYLDLRLTVESSKEKP